MTLTDLASRIGRDIKALRDGKTDTTDPRLSDARPPTTHTHPVGDVDGLAARLAALEYDSGWRNISALLTNSTGEVYIVRSGFTVTLRFHGISLTSGTAVEVLALPAGFVPRSVAALGPRTILHSSNLVIGRLFTLGAKITYNAGTGNPPAYGDFTFRTNDAPPSTLPGSPA